MMQLSRRLQAVADMVTDTDCVADVGTDHGYVPIYLVEHGICNRAIAMDIRKGPLQRAQEHIEEHQLGAYIQTRLSDGLAALKRDEAKTIVIAGMGGATMSGILEAGKNVIGPETMLVLQPQSELLEFRQYLGEHGYEVLAEDMVREDGKFYPMMKVRRSGNGAVKPNGARSENEAAAGRSLKGELQPPFTRLELLYGPLLLAQKHPVLKEFLVWQLGQKGKILENLSRNASLGTKAERMEQIEEEMSCIRQALSRY